MTDTCNGARCTKRMLAEAILKTMMPPMVLDEVQSSLKDAPGASGFTHHPALTCKMHAT